MLVPSDSFRLLTQNNWYRAHPVLSDYLRLLRTRSGYIRIYSVSKKQRVSTKTKRVVHLSSQNIKDICPTVISQVTVLQYALSNDVS